MKKIKYVKLIMAVMAFVITFNALTFTSEAKGKSKIYYSCMTGQKSSDSSMGDIYKIKLKNNKLTIWGSFTKYNSSKDFSKGKGKFISYKKRTFTLSKKVKYYGDAGGEVGAYKLSKKEFKQGIKNMNGLGFKIVIKNNKVVKIGFES